MKRIWSDYNKFKIWEKVELAVAEVMVKKGIVPESSFKVIKKKTKLFVPFTERKIILENIT